MAYETLQGLSLPAIFVLLFVAIMVAAEIGNWIGRRSASKSGDKDAGNMAAATLGLLALLIGFTYAMAVSRYDLRRQTVLEEANAIGSTVNFALMLPQADQAAILAELREYTNLRIGLGSPYDPAKLDADVRRSGDIRADLWRRAVAAEAAQPQSLGIYQFVFNLNEMNNMGEKRLTALRNHVPFVVTFMLAGTALIAMGFVGYGAGCNGNRRIYADVVLALLISGLIALMLDLQRPDRGSIDIPTQPLQDTLAAFPSSSP